MAVFGSREFTEEEQTVATVIKGAASDLDGLLKCVPDSREKSLSITKLEECVMWAQKAIALHGVKLE